MASGLFFGCGPISLWQRKSPSPRWAARGRRHRCSRGGGGGAAPPRWRGGRWTPGPFHLFLPVGEQRRSDPAAPPPQTTGSKRGCCPKGGPPRSQPVISPPSRAAIARPRAGDIFSSPRSTCRSQEGRGGLFPPDMPVAEGEKRGGAAYLSAPTSVCAFSSSIQCQEEFLCRLDGRHPPKTGSVFRSPAQCAGRGREEGETPPALPLRPPRAGSPQVSSARRSFSATWVAITRPKAG